MSTDTKVTDLILNELTEEKLKELEDAGTVPPNEIFFTDDDETSPRGLPLGTIIPSSIVSDDASLHLLDGSSLLQTGIYKQFCTWLKKRVLDNSNNVPTCTIAEYASEMTIYGQCGKFVINDTSSVQTSNGYRVEANSIKLPTITEFIASNNGGDSIGLAELDEFKLHDHWLEFRASYSSAAGSNAVTSNNYSSPNGNLGGIKSGTAGGEETKPKNVRYPYYIVVASSVKTDVEVDIDNVASDINVINGVLNNTEQVETVYDMNDSAKDWGYSGGIPNDTTINRDFSKYKKLRLYTAMYEVQSVIELDLTTPSTNNTFNVFNCCWYVIDSKLIARQYATVDNTKQSLKLNIHYVYADTGVGVYNNERYIYSKIEGVY